VARVVQVGEVSAIPKADAIELAKIGGWSAVVKKGAHRKGDLAVYFEIDTFLPEGNPAWQFLVDTHPTEFQGARGHALRTVRLRGQVSQGLLLSFAELGISVEEGRDPSFDPAARFGAKKYEEPLPPDLEKVARGMLPTLVPRTKQERIQNLESEFALWQADGARGERTWEATEKLEGASCTFAWIKKELHACSHRVDYLSSSDNEFWQAAKLLDIENKCEAEFGARSFALQGELVGPGQEGNVYLLAERQFLLYEVVDLDQGRKLLPSERRDLAEKMGIPHVPLLGVGLAFNAGQSMEQLVAASDAESLFVPGRRREGVVYKCEQDAEVSFKAISNDYLVNGANMEPKLKRKPKHP
jgi:RNA ligase (TIGR02306 family)